MDLTNKTELINYLQSHGLYTKHSLGQNFLVDRDSLDQIIEAADIQPTDLIIEVGAGLGTMTEELVSKANKVIAVELDEKLAGLLKENIKASNLEIIQSDILKTNIPKLVGREKYKVVANIPYYITSKIIQLFLTLEHKPESIVLLTQKEVAERICAKPGEMSTLSISVQAYGKPEIVGIVPRSSFFPAPEVDSAILRIKDIHQFCHSRLDLESRALDPRVKPEDDRACVDEKEFFRLVHIGFASRRKTLINNLSAGLHIDKSKASDIIKATGLSENVRAQELSVEKWAELTRLI